MLTQNYIKKTVENLFSLIDNIFVVEVNKFIFHLYKRSIIMAILNTRSSNGNSKSAIATRIYQEMANGEEQFTRKQVIDRFVTEAGLTPSGAATYYFNITKKAKQVVGSDVVVQPEAPEPTTEQPHTVAVSRNRRSK
jgi:hypothetical protein